MKNRDSWCLVGIVSLYRIDGMLVDHVDEALFGKIPRSDRGHRARFIALFLHCASVIPTSKAFRCCYSFKHTVWEASLTTEFRYRHRACIWHICTESESRA